MVSLEPESAARALAAWFASLRDRLDHTVFATGNDEPHRRAAALTVVARHTALLEAASGQVAAEVREAIWVIAGATRFLGIELAEANWLAAARNASALDAQLGHMGSNAWVVPDAAAIFREQLVEALRQAGVARVPTILDAQNRKAALGLAVNWGLRFVISAAAGLVGREIEDDATREVVAALSG